VSCGHSFFIQSLKNAVRRQPRVHVSYLQWPTQEFCSGGGGVQQIQLRTEDRENGDLGAIAP